MANYCVHVESCGFDQANFPNQAVLLVHAGGDNGVDVRVPVGVDFASASTQMNTKIVDGIKAQLQSQGVSVGSQDKFYVFGGAS